MDLSKIHCLSIRYDGISNVAACSVKVCYPQSILSADEAQISDDCIGIWDTGATGSAITELFAAKIGLKPVGRKKVSGLGGTIDKNRYLIDVILPNNVRVPDLSVTEIDNPIDDDGNKLETFGMLIGMDIICRGDFSLTNYEGKTVMSFRMPSMFKNDYVDEWNRRQAVQNKYKRR
jgi:hypothetical protein